MCPTKEEICINFEDDRLDNYGENVQKLINELWPVIAEVRPNSYEEHLEIVQRP